MTAGSVTAALGRALGRFSEGWGNEFDHTDPHDVAALGHLVFQELDVATDREAARKCLRMIEEWGEQP